MHIGKKLTAWLLILLPVVAFFWLFFKYTVNMPVNDDYQAVLDFLNNYVTAKSFGEKLNLVFAQHMEHRIVFSRVWTLISYKLQHNVNFNFLSFIGNLSLIGIALIFFRKFRSLDLSLFLFVPVTVLIFNITSWENMTFPMCAASNFVVHMFILLSLSYLTKPAAQGQKNILLAILFLVMAFLSQGASVALLPVSILVLLYKKEYKNLLIYFACISVVLFLYFHHYFRPPVSGDIVTAVADFKVRSIVFVFGFLGNAFDYFLIFTDEKHVSFGMSSIIGFGFFLLFLYITKTKYYQKNLFNYSVMVLILTTAVMAAISRSSMDMEMATASRYRINGCIFAISLYFWFIETYRIRRSIGILAVLAVSGWYLVVINWMQYEYLDSRREKNYLEALCFRTGDESIVNENKETATEQRRTLLRSARLNIFHPLGNEQIESFFPHSRKEADGTVSDNSSAEMTKNIHLIRRLGNDYLLEGYGFLDGRSTTHQKLYIGIKNQGDSSPVFYRAAQFPRFDLNNWFHRFNPQNGGLVPRIKSWLHQVNLRDGGFWARISVDELKPGLNTLWIKVVAEGQVKTVQTDSTIAVCAGSDPSCFVDNTGKFTTRISPVRIAPLAPVSKDTGRVEYNFEIAEKLNGKIHIEGWAVLKQPKAGMTTNLLFQSDSATFMIRTQMQQRPDLVAVYHDVQAQDGGFTIEFPEAALPSGSYKIGIQKVSPDQQTVNYVFSSKELRIQAPPRVTAALPTPSVFTGNIDQVKDEDEQTVISGWAVTKMSTVQQDRVFLVLKGESTSYTVETAPLPRPDIVGRFKDEAVKNCGFSTRFSPTFLPPGKYRLGILVEHKDGPGELMYLEQFLTNNE